MAPAPGPSDVPPSAVPALNECAQAAADCARRCRELDPVAMAGCIATCEACAAICATTAEVLQLGSTVRPEIVFEQARAALVAMRSAAGECGGNAEDAAKQCADVCTSTSQALEELLHAARRRA